MSSKETYVASPLGRFGRRFIDTCAGFTMLYLFAPIFIIVAFSFNNPKSKFNFTWSGFTIKHWVKTIRGGTPDKFFYPELNQALIRSVMIGLVVSVIATSLGTLMAFALARYKVKGSGFLATFLVLPLTIPEIVLGASLFTMFLDFSVHVGGFNIGFTPGYVTILLAHVMFCMSYVTLTVKARMRGFDWQLEDAAQDLGATPKKHFGRSLSPLRRRESLRPSCYLSHYPSTTSLLRCSLRVMSRLSPFVYLASLEPRFHPKSTSFPPFCWW